VVGEGRDGDAVGGVIGSRFVGTLRCVRRRRVLRGFALGGVVVLRELELVAVVGDRRPAVGRLGLGVGVRSGRAGRLVGFRRLGCVGGLFVGVAVVPGSSAFESALGSSTRWPRKSRSVCRMDQPRSTLPLSWTPVTWTYTSSPASQPRDSTRPGTSLRWSSPVTLSPMSTKTPNSAKPSTLPR